MRATKTANCHIGHEGNQLPYSIAGERGNAATQPQHLLSARGQRVEKHT
jgi:hypothetical protein